MFMLLENYASDVPVARIHVKKYSPWNLGKVRIGGVTSFSCIVARNQSPYSFELSNFVGCPFLRLTLSGADIRAKFGINRLNTLQSARKNLNSVKCEGGLSLSIAAVSCGATLNETGLITSPR